MTTSTAPHGSFLFAQQTSEGMCHLSFNSTEDARPFNVQVRMSDVTKMIENLARVQGGERIRLEQECNRLRKEQ